MSDLSWLDEIEGLEQTGDQNEHGEGGVRSFRGLPIWKLNGRTGEYTHKDRDGNVQSEKLMFGAVLGYSEVRTMFFGMSTPQAWQAELGKHQFPDKTPLCRWEGGSNSPRIRENLPPAQVKALQSYGAGVSCNICSLGQWGDVGGNRVKPACPAHVAVLFLPLVGEKKTQFADKPIILTASNYRSVDEVQGKRPRNGEPIMSLSETADQFSVSKHNRMIPAIALKAKFGTESFDTPNGPFYKIDYSFHGIFEKEQVQHALRLFKEWNVFEPSDEVKMLAAPAGQPALTAGECAPIDEAQYTVKTQNFGPAPGHPPNSIMAETDAFSHDSVPF